MNVFATVILTCLAPTGDGTDGSDDFAAWLAQASREYETKELEWIPGIELGLYISDFEIEATTNDSGVLSDHDFNSIGAFWLAPAVEVRIEERFCLKLRYEWSEWMIGEPSGEGKLQTFNFLVGYRALIHEDFSLTIFAGVVRADFETADNDFPADFDPVWGPHLSVRGAFPNGRVVEWTVEMGVRFLDFDTDEDANVVDAGDVGGGGFFLSVGIGFRL